MLVSDAVKTVGGASVLALVFLSQFVPTAYVPVKAVLLVIALFCALWLLVSGSVSVNHGTMWAMVATSFVGGCFTLYGLVRNNPGAAPLATVMIAWPLVYLALSTFASLPRAMHHLARCLSVTFFLVVAYGLIYLGHASGIVPDALYIELDQGQEVSFYEGFIEFQLYSISSLLFLLPFFVHYRWLQLTRQGVRSSAIMFAVPVALGFLLAIMTGRRAVILVALVSIVSAYFVGRFFGAAPPTLSPRERRKLRRKILLAAVVVTLGVGLLATLSGLEFTAVYDMVADGFDFSEQVAPNESAAERANQFVALLHGWFDDSLIFGNGSGAVGSILRSDEQPWAYELTYVYMLFSTGLLGVAWYGGWVAWGLFRLRRELRARPDLFIYVGPLVTGCIGLCIGAATNPYLAKFDYLWIVMLPHLIAGGLRWQSLNLQPALSKRPRRALAAAP